MKSVQNTQFFLVRIFPHSDWIRIDTSYLSLFSPHAGKYGPEKTPYLDTFHTVLFAPKFVIFQTFLNFLISSVIGCLAISEATFVPGYRHQVFFYYWKIGPVLNHCNVGKYYDQNYLKIFSLLSTLPIMIQFSVKRAH